LSFPGEESVPRRSQASMLSRVLHEQVKPLWYDILDGRGSPEGGLRLLTSCLQSLRMMEVGPTGGSRGASDRDYGDLAALLHLLEAIAAHDLATDSFHRWLLAESSSDEVPMRMGYRLGLYGCVVRMLGEGWCSERVYLEAAFSPHRRIRGLVRDSRNAPLGARVAAGLAA